MYRNSYQKGYFPVFYSIGTKPLDRWCIESKNGHIKRITDLDIRSVTLELIGNNVSTTYVNTPVSPYTSLAIRLPFLVLIVKNLNKHFSFEVEVLDDQNFRRRFRCSNFTSCTRVGSFSCTMPLALDKGWNKVHLNLPDYCRRAFGTSYVETTRIQIHANCRLRRVYFCEDLNDKTIPVDYQLFVMSSPGIGGREMIAI